MRSTLFWKLFALQLLAGAALIAGVLLVTRLQTAHSFAAFLEAQERPQLRRAAERIARLYAETGDLRLAAEAAIERPPPRYNDRGPRPPPWEGAPPPPPPGGGDRPPPLWVEDLAGRRLLGQGAPGGGNVLREPILLEGELIGHVVQPRLPPWVQEGQARFSERQTRALWLAGAGALVLAGLFAVLIAAMILRPIRRLSQGATALARREFATRLAVDSGDELGRLAEDFNRLAEALERYDQRQRQWLADIAHELRTPLAVLRGELEAILDGVRPANLAQAKSLHQEVLRLGALVEDLHLLSLAESGGLALHRERIESDELLRTAAERFRERLAARGFALQLDLPEQPLWLDLDPQRVEQVLANLFENVLRHAHPPGTVRLSAQPQAGGLRVRLADSGPGVPASALPRLFERLYRVDAARSRKAGGSGLGLSICRSIVEAHGGRIGAARADSGGLEIDFWLPAT